MSKRVFGPMIVTAALLTAPVLAAADTSGTSPAASSSPATTAPAQSNMSAGVPASHHATTPSPMAGSSTAQKAPVYTTSDGKIRLGKLVGASVYNDQNQSIGSVDDVLMDTGHKADTAVLSVGGFLGMGSKLVAVPIDQLKVRDDKVVMPGATKASLESMPDFKFNA